MWTDANNYMVANNITTPATLAQLWGYVNTGETS